MKKTAVLLLPLVLVLTGCSSVSTFEILGNVYDQDTPAQAEISLELPADASAQTVSGDTGTIYFCDGYEILVETVSGGDLSATLNALSGFDPQALTVMQTRQGTQQCYETAWSSAAENGFQTARTKILDDGAWHYCVTLLAPAEEVAALQAQWQAIMDSFCLDQG